MTTSRLPSFLAMALGLWLISCAATYFYDPITLRWSDALVGILLVVTGAVRPGLLTGLVLAVLGLWLGFAPLALWSAVPFSYLNDTLISALTIGLAFRYFPRASQGKECCPPGWSFNPSSWHHRIPVIFLAFLAWSFARYMASYQLGYLPQITDPVFGQGTFLVVTSKISKAFPVSDAGMGALAYMIEVVLGWQGDERRWCSMPWLALAFGLLVVPVGMVSILLIILQPIAVGAWCFWCLLTACCMLVMATLAISEFVAALVFLGSCKRDGKSLIKTALCGATPTGAACPERNYFLPGVTPTWTLALCALMGLWLVVNPILFYYASLQHSSDIFVHYIVGPLIVAFSVLAMAEVARALRFLNILLVLVLLLWTPFAEAASALIWANHLGTSVVLILLSIPKGKIRYKYGSYERFIF